MDPKQVTPLLDNRWRFVWKRIDSRGDTDGRDNSLFIDSLYFAQLKLLLQFYKYFQAKPLFRYWILEIDNEKKTTIAHSFINTLLFKISDLLKNCENGNTVLNIITFLGFKAIRLDMFLALLLQAKNTKSTKFCFGEFGCCNASCKGELTNWYSFGMQNFLWSLFWWC